MFLLLNKCTCIDFAEKFIIKNGDLSILTIYMILWAHMQHTNYATLVCAKFSFRADLTEELSESHMSGLSSEIVFITDFLLQSG